MRIRLARPEDFDAWLPLWKGYQDFYRVDIPEAVTRQTWQRLHDPAEPMHCAVAEAADALVGMVHYIFHRSCWTVGDYCYLQDLFTVPERRGQGVGRALIEHVYAQAASAGASRVWWLTHESNTPGRLLYDRVADNAGFIQYRKTVG